MAKVIPVGPIDPVLYGFAKKQAEMAERDPRYTPKKLETPGHSITYRRVGATVKAFVVDKIAPVWTGKEKSYALPIMQKIDEATLPEEILELKFSNSAYSTLGTSLGERCAYISKRREVYEHPSWKLIDLTDFARMHTIYTSEVTDGSIEVEFTTDNQNNTATIVDSLVLGSTGPYQIKNGVPVVDLYRYPTTIVSHDLSGLVSSNGMLNGLGATALSNKDPQGSNDIKQTYNYVAQHDASSESRLIYYRLNPANFSAKKKEDLLPDVHGELFVSSYVHSYQYNPMDLGFFWDVDQIYKTPVSTTPTSSMSLVPSGGKIADIKGVAVDCVGNFYYLEISAAHEGGTISPPWVLYGDNDSAYTISPTITQSRTLSLFKNEEMILQQQAIDSDGDNRTNLQSLIEYPATYHNMVASSDIIAVVYGSMEPEGGAALLMNQRYYGDAAMSADFTDDWLDCASVFVKSGIYCIGYDNQASGEIHCVLFIPNPTPADLHPVIHMSKVGEPKNYYILKPHKKYDPEKETELNRFTRASLFVSAKNPNPTEKGRRCYISFDDGVCMDLTDFADALEADPNISAEDWDGKPFRYSPMEPIDADAADYDYYDFKPRRIKRAYAPQWVRAYYDYEDQP